MGGIGCFLPTKIPEMPFDSQAWKAALQDFRRLSSFLASPQLCQGRRSHRKNLKMIRIHIERFARPRQRSVILAQKVMAERVQGRPLVSGVTVTPLHRHRKQLDGLPMLSGNEVADAKHAAGAHVIRVQLDRALSGVQGFLIIPLHRVHVGQKRKRE